MLTQYFFYFGSFMFSEFFTEFGEEFDLFGEVYPSETFSGLVIFPCIVKNYLNMIAHNEVYSKSSLDENSMCFVILPFSVKR